LWNSVGRCNTVSTDGHRSLSVRRSADAWWLGNNDAIRLA